MDRTSLNSAWVEEDTKPEISIPGFCQVPFSVGCDYDTMAYFKT